MKLIELAYFTENMQQMTDLFMDYWGPSTYLRDPDG